MDNPKPSPALRPGARPHTQARFRHFLSGLAILCAARAPFAEPSFALYPYNLSRSETRVDGSKAYDKDVLPIGFEMGGIGSDGYMEFGIDAVGKYLFLFFGLADENDYGKDESFLNFKAGFFKGGEKLALGYGFDLDTRVNDYREDAPSVAKHKVRIGFGPNLGLRMLPFPAMSLFPNVSGYAYPWPNEDFAFIPKSGVGWGYRAEMPVLVDLIRLFTVSATETFTLAVKPFYAWKSGFYSKNDQTGATKDAEAGTWGVKFGFWVQTKYLDALSWK